MRLYAQIALLGLVQGYQVRDNIRQQALTLLRSRRKNTGFFEESRDDDFERECMEELCSAEELREVYPDNEMQRSMKWRELTQQCYINKCDAQGTHVCIQTWNQRECKCKTGFAGDSCSDDIDECAAGATCPENAQCTNSHGSYSCGCRGGFNQIAQEKDGFDFWCSEEPICHLCTGANKHCENNDCKCNDGYATDDLDSLSADCTDIDECADEDACGAHSTCSNFDGGYTCSCDSGYEEIGSFCVDADECSDGSNSCDASARCVNNEGSYICECEAGFALIGDNLFGVCTDVNECETGAHDCDVDETCHNMVGVFKCCASGHVFVDGECLDSDPCSGVVCGEGQDCSKGECFCSNVYQQMVGAVCVDVDECAEYTAHCNWDTQDCVNKDSTGYECACKEGFSAAADDSCVQDATEAPVTEPATEPAPTEPAPTPKEKAVERPITDAPTDAPKTETFPPATNPPQPTYCPVGFEMAVVDSSGTEGCVDVDECQTNNGGCRHPQGMCMNFYGSHYCYSSMNEETVLCHHEHVDDASSETGYRCTCYDGYSLCHDQFTCVADRRMSYNGDDSADCADGQTALDGTCYEASSSKASYADAASDCAARGGALATVNSRLVWWNLGNMMGNGVVPFWINAQSNPSIQGANTHVVDDGGENYLVNIVPSMNAVPPQWNAMSGDEAHHYWCQF